MPNVRTMVRAITVTVALALAASVTTPAYVTYTVRIR